MIKVILAAVAHSSVYQRVGVHLAGVFGYVD